ncbi:hypothetical protein [Kutzneria buriramensis]|uniref:Uncharacterized protein n=1 Tax=Kutzneria buriramensis TaxID=1045776 RepID=A0A3E0GST4_9PSEU|nr:hypothetical protein [Kutzneria buriramensis]REH26194.1 hypothetical protein BCF44_13449 [Kutzneria buriramensis]
MSDRDPIIDEWLRGSEISELALSGDQLFGLHIASERAASTCPEPVLERWYMTLSRHRAALLWSEKAFIAQARRNGWDWARIATALSLPDAEAASRREEFLAAFLRRTHPSQDPQPWLPWGDPRVG